MSTGLRHHWLSVDYMPPAGSLGTGDHALRGRTLYKFLAIVAVLVAVTVSMLVVKWDYRVEGKGRARDKRALATSARRSK